MPMYEYQCNDCSEITDFLCGFSERPDSIVCEACGGHAERILSSPNINVKSGGGMSGKEEDWAKSKTIGEYWDRQGVKAKGKEAQKASKERIEKMRKKAND